MVTRYAKILQKKSLGRWVGRGLPVGGVVMDIPRWDWTLYWVISFYTGCSLRLIQSLKMAGNTFCLNVILILCLREQKDNKPNRQFTFNNHRIFTVHPILIMEYLPCGDLLGFLRKSRGIVDKYYRGEGEVANLKTYELVSFSNQIATGMVFLASRGVCNSRTK